MAPISRTRLWAVARKELVQLRRDPRSLILAFLLPVFLLVMFGYAITWDVRDIAMVVVDQDHTAKSRELVDAFAASGYFRLIGHLASAADVPPRFDRNQARIGLVIPPGFERDLERGQGAPLQALVDGADANTATIALAYARATVQSWAQRAIPRAAAFRPPLIAESRVWYNEELVSRNMIVPGLVATIMMIISAMLTALTIAREWERGTMEQLAATPVTRVEVVLASCFPISGSASRRRAHLRAGRADSACRSAAACRCSPYCRSCSWWARSGWGSSSPPRPSPSSSPPRWRCSPRTCRVPALGIHVRARSDAAAAARCRPGAGALLPGGDPRIFLKGIGLDILWSQALLMVAFAVLGMTLAVHAFRKELE
jgi:ABC-2 type transport system permease protein